MVTKEQTIDLLETIAQLLELKGENPFKIRAYTNAARALETYSGNFPNLVEENGLQDLAGIGEAIAKKISRNLYLNYSKCRGSPVKKSNYSGRNCR
jgi:DNA polymerase (family 10)